MIQIILWTALIPIFLDGDDTERAPGGDDEEGGLPFACFICREQFDLSKNPVVTK